MEVERWGEEEEVAMDVDVSEADMAAMKAVRENLPPSSNLDLGAFGVPRDYTNDYSVSGNLCLFVCCCCCFIYVCCCCFMFVCLLLFFFKC